MGTIPQLWDALLEKGITFSVIDDRDKLMHLLGENDAHHSQTKPSESDDDQDMNCGIWSDDEENYLIIAGKKRTRSSRSGLQRKLKICQERAYRHLRLLSSWLHDRQEGPWLGKKSEYHRLGP